MRENQAILIEGDKVKQVGAAADVAKVAPLEVRVIDLGNATVLPGLIDCHTHVTGQPENYYEDIFRKSPIDVATTSHIYARRTLLAGFTTIRNGAEAAERTTEAGREVDPVAGPLGAEVAAGLRAGDLAGCGIDLDRGVVVGTGAAARVSSARSPRGAGEREGGHPGACVVRPARVDMRRRRCPGLVPHRVIAGARGLRSG